MVWCNALTEYYNFQNGTSLDCVYADGANIVRDSRVANALICDNVTAVASVKSFRLPTSGEWELAGVNDMSGMFGNGALTSTREVPTGWVVEVAGLMIQTCCRSVLLHTTIRSVLPIIWVSASRRQSRLTHKPFRSMVATYKSPEPSARGFSRDDIFPNCLP
mgnify:CR=1 FL=1